MGVGWVSGPGSVQEGCPGENYPLVKGNLVWAAVRLGSPTRAQGPESLRERNSVGLPQALDVSADRHTAAGRDADP